MFSGSVLELFDNPNKFYSYKAIVHLAKLKPSDTAKRLKRLQKAGVIKTFEKGKKKYYYCSVF